MDWIFGYKAHGKVAGVTGRGEVKESESKEERNNLEMKWNAMDMVFGQISRFGEF